MRPPGPVNWPADPDAWLTPPDALGSWVATAVAQQFTARQLRRSLPRMATRQGGRMNADRPVAADPGGDSFDCGL
jgi:hypothetical protein